MSYYSLPSVKCSERKNILNNLYTSNSDKCININPSSIYNNLFPGFNQPMSKFTNTTGSGFDNINSLTNVTQEDCASNCLLKSNEGCNYFNYKNSTKTCTLLNTKDPELVTSTQSGVKSNIYTKKDNQCNTSTDPDCVGCADFCPTTNNDSYDLTGTGLILNDNNQRINDPIAVSNIDTCMDNCNNDTNCQSFIYTESESKCDLYKKRVDGTDILYKKNEDLENKINMDYLSYYNSYKNGDAKVGDYTCAFDNSNQNCYELSQEECGTNNCKSTEDKVDDNGTDIYNFPIPRSKLAGRGDGKMGINGFIFNKCISNNGSCIGPVFTNDNMGFPKRYRTPNPPTQSYMVKNSFDKKKQTKFVNCPTGYSPNEDGTKCIDGANICVPNNVENTDGNKACSYSKDNALLKRRPELNAFSNVEGCKNWCNKDKDCKAVSAYFEDGNAKCHYYNNKIFNDFSNLVTSYNHTVYTKRAQEKDYQFNMKQYAESLVDNDIPLSPTLNQIINPYEYDTQNNYFNFTSCLSDDIIQSKTNNITSACMTQFGKGYVAAFNSMEGRKDCSNNKYRYRCELNPASNLNVKSLNLIPKIQENFTSGTEHFSSANLLNGQTLVLFLSVVILTFIIIKYFLK
jgi:hypothetical protein